MRAAALSADVVVPVIALPSMASDLAQNEGFLRKEWADLVSVVVVTKIQQENVHVQQKRRFAQVALGSRERSKDILPCDSLLGLGGLRLRDYLDERVDIPTRFKDKEDPISEV